MSQVQGPGSSEPPADQLQGQINTELIERMRQSITEALDAEEVRVVDVSGGESLIQDPAADRSTAQMITADHCLLIL